MSCTRSRCHLVGIALAFPPCTSSRPQPRTITFSCYARQDAHNLLRPESVESFYVLWKVTGHPQYRSWAWQVGRYAAVQR